MSESVSVLHDLLIELSGPIVDSISKTRYRPPEGSTVSVKAILESLLPPKSSLQKPRSSLSDHQGPSSIRNFALACALLSSSLSSNHELLSWIPKDLSVAADSAFRLLSKSYATAFGEKNSIRIGELVLDIRLVPEEKRLVWELIPDVFPLLKEKIKESSIDKSDELNEISAASARAPVGLAIVAAYQFRWFVTQVGYPHVGKLCTLLIPCALTALDHWSPEVKAQGMISLVHIAKNVNSAELGWYEDAILDACCQNIACNDEIWHHVVEMSVLLVTSIHHSDPRNSWFDRMLTEMLSHLERQPRNQERRVVWLQHIEPLFNCMGLVLVAHSRRIFPLFFQWMNAEDDETVLLVLQRVHTVIRLTWIRNTPYVPRLVDELAALYKKAALRKPSEEIRSSVLRTLALLKQCKGLQFEAAWDKHRADPNLAALLSTTLNEPTVVGGRTS